METDLLILSLLIISFILDKGIGVFLVHQMFSIRSKWIDLSGRLDPDFSRKNVTVVYLLCLYCIVDMESFSMMPWKTTIFTEKSGGFPSMIVYQIVVVSEAFFKTLVALLISLATAHNEFTELTFFFSVLFSIYAFTNLIIKLKIEDIAQYEMILVHKDSRIISPEAEIQNIELALSPMDAIAIETGKPIIPQFEYPDEQNELLRFVMVSNRSKKKSSAAD